MSVPSAFDSLPSCSSVPVSAIVRLQPVVLVRTVTVWAPLSTLVPATSEGIVIVSGEVTVIDDPTVPDKVVTSVLAAPAVKGIINTEISARVIAELKISFFNYALLYIRVA